MADFTFFANPMSRAWVAWWALNEVGADFDLQLVEWDNKPQALLDVNPLGKVPTLIHHLDGRDHVITECAAVCHYLAEVSPDAGLLPTAEERAAYYRLLFYVSGPVEQALVSDSMGWKADDPQKEAMLGFGNYTKAMDTLEVLLSDGDFVCGDRFTMADVYVGSQVDWGLRFGTLPDRPLFQAYAERVRARDAYKQTEAECAEHMPTSPS
ncbi:glutathione S-transferase family protein [Qipengyuania sp. DGS5-3]|uniref:glutathione S-transferase family protein n=1 Tax=Qipengyuania sp. DGS5-3 TaxID=3349632 RepID=UPI0036D29451